MFPAIPPAGSMNDSDYDSQVNEQSSDNELENGIKTEPDSSSEERPKPLSPLPRGRKRRRLDPDDDAHHKPPQKRRKSTHKPKYLKMLMCDIDDASRGVCLEKYIKLPESQVGLIVWSPEEKHRFFEAVTRLGRHDLPGIASRVRTKSLVEIRQYLLYLQEADIIRRKPGQDTFVEFAEYPAAVELSQQCCHALEEAADAVALVEIQDEAKKEVGKWGDCWDLTPEVAAKLKEIRDTVVDHPFAQLFHVDRWLKVSERIFMNSSVHSDNWYFVDDNPPSIWATALQDFHKLAVSLTRRLVQTALFFSMMRIRKKKRRHPDTQPLVRRIDVARAIRSFDLAPNSRRFWRKSARRLRLHVYREPPRPGDDTKEPMSYEEVEAELAGKDKKKRKRRVPIVAQPSIEMAESSESEDEEKPPFDDESSSTIKPAKTPPRRRSTTPNKSTRRSPQPRLTTDTQRDEQAEAWDAHASHAAELDLWALLRRKPPKDLPPPPPEPELLLKSAADVLSSYPAGGVDWTRRVKYVQEWALNRGGKG
ncbi:Homeodomain-like protein [Ophiocordyceps camponoti-floridani]|uniref:Homeodomain-like protein n=1 Tax=Ophiocordyceps camponoti-floridani TaxID=2030778 RepID=A0A8H4Q678_9HYPO|nr:Homeodomain-like protein [Ophiocordyceps camponoti-floridani]